jgi:hypothetical protein
MNDCATVIVGHLLRERTDETDTLLRRQLAPLLVHEPIYPIADAITRFNARVGLLVGLAALAVIPGVEARTTPAATIAARQRIFGIENVNAANGKVRQDRVVFSWLTNATFAAAMKGHIVLLDTFVTRLETTPGRTPLVIQDLVDLRPDAIFLGHGHFDHADNAAYIAQETAAIIYASPETCDNITINATNNYNNGYTLAPAVTCKPLTDRGSLPGKEVVSINDFEPEVSITAFKHLHSTNTGVTDPDAVAIVSYLQHNQPRALIPITSQQWQWRAHPSSGRLASTMP